MHDARDRNQGIWIEYNDRLYVAAYSSVASLVVTFSGYFRKADGEIVEYAVTVSPTSDRAVTAVNQHFGAGFLLSCVATLASGNANRGQCYVRAQIQRSTGTPAVKLHNVLGGYLSDDYSPSFPYGKIEGPLEGPGYLRYVIGTDPATGVDVLETVPAGARWRILSIIDYLAVDVTVASRYVELDYYRSSGYIYAANSTQAQIATQGRSYVFALGVEYSYLAAALQETIALSWLTLLAGDQIALVAINGVAGDDWQAPSLYVEEWIEA